MKKNRAGGTYVDDAIVGFFETNQDDLFSQRKKQDKADEEKKEIIMRLVFYRRELFTFMLPIIKK
ncbi:MAG: hypothetical protein JW840_09210 [Candidatus Thermoplasmatota archaeon]|nr:hypothetical protein [Candidatus Thermoplasmatota archaeon]